ncbi:MAG: CbtA family protein [Mycobacterium sp.]
MEKRIIGRGLLAGVLGGLLAFVFARIFVEPLIDLAIGYEDGVGAAHEAMQAASGAEAHSHGEEGGFEITRGIQANPGLAFGVIGFGLAMGALFAVAYVAAYGRFGSRSARLLSVQVAAGLFVALYLVPFLKYPPSPPAVSLDETINQRTLLYVLLVAISAALIIGAAYLREQLVARLDQWNATLAAIAAYIVAIAVVFLVMPGIHETPGPLVDDAGVIVYAGFPADVFYEFRLFSLLTQVVLWATIALVFAPLAARLLEDKREQAAV